MSWGLRIRKFLGSSETSPRDHRDLVEWERTTGSWLWLTVLAVLLAGLGLRLGLMNTLDLRDLPGAGGAESIHHVLRGRFAQWGTWFIGLMLPVTDGDPVLAARWVAQISGMAMLVGVMLGGWAVAGRVGALACAVVAAGWAMAVMPVLLVGSDPPAVGLAWLGLGLVWAGARLGRAGLVMMMFGTGLLVLAIDIKPIALPVVGLLPVAPLCFSRTLREGVLRILVIGAMVALAWQWFSPELQQHSGSLEPLSVGSFFGGFPAFLSMVENWPDGALFWLVAASVVFGLVPGTAWLRRVALVLCGLGVLALTAAGLGSRLCPRLLLASTYACVVAAAMLMLVLGHRVRQSKGSRWVPLCLLSLFLSMDTWGWVAAWDQERTRFAESERSAIPSAPWFWGSRYAVYADPRHRDRLMDLTSAGAVTLMSQAEGARGIAIPTLRDRREQHLTVAAAQAGIPIIILDEYECCPYPTSLECAENVVSELSQAGVRLVIPGDAGEGMVNAGSSWPGWIREAAETDGGLVDLGAWWSVRAPVGQNGSMPCSPRYTARLDIGWPPPRPL